MYLGHHVCEDVFHVCRVSDRDMYMCILGMRMYCIYIECLNIGV